MYGHKSPVHVVYMPKKVKPRFKAKHKNFIRKWRVKKGLTLEALAARVGEKIGGMTHASLSRIERGIQPYSQPILEAIAEELTGGDVGSLLMRDPDDPEGIWTIWDQAKAVERRMIVEVARTIVKTGT